MIGRRTCVALASVALVLGLAGCGSAPEGLKVGRPPVILISIDTLRSDRLPAYGYAAVETPHLDRFARDAVLFERAYSHYPMTLPSHASLLTGQLPPRHGVRDNRGYRLGADLPTLAALLSDAGYHTAGVVSSSVLRSRTGIGRGFELYDDTLGGTRQESLRVFPQRPGSQSIAVAENWLEQFGAGDRFFLFLHLFEPHTPYEAPAPYATRYADPYDAEVAYTDELVGGFLERLRERGLYDPALIVVLSDHGEGLGDHGETEHGLLLYRETLQVPLMVKLPGALRAGERMDAPVALTDVMPTVLDLLDLSMPEPEGWALFGAEPPPRDRPIYSETWFSRHQYGWSELKSAIRDRRHYIRAPRPELYDLVDDPAERRNLLETEPPPVELQAWIEEIGVGAEATAELTPEELESLAALGYIGGAGAEGGWQDLPDPKDHIERVEELWAQIERIGSDGTGQAETRVLELAASLGIRNEALFRTIAQNLLGAGRPGLALQVLDPYRSSTDVATRLVVGQALLESGRPGQAVEQLRAVVEAAPTDPEGHLGLGLAWLAGDRLEPARNHLERALELEPALPEAWNGLGVIHARSGQLDEAVRMWRRAVDLDPSLSDTWFNLALVQRRMGRPSEAVDAMRRYAELVDGPDLERAEEFIRETVTATETRTE